MPGDDGDRKRSSSADSRKKGMRKGGVWREHAEGRRVDLKPTQSMRPRSKTIQSQQGEKPGAAERCTQRVGFPAGSKPVCARARGNPPAIQSAEEEIPGRLEIAIGYAAQSQHVSPSPRATMSERTAAEGLREQ
eukprot:CAMPEP_0181344306 /NCGR_PEP_ID=MMETSP1101-20121128/32104_1 /TAXON_ID=46948 /ORGANISM="Rhodomonas abbreviata, Strain Caron Lab Isolate" /LENGTH=133 /DNA_ID=CAMNT_0023456103 /DNA_START=144 /DNA_END=545 /DNA_ORIENTATION=-